MTQEQRTTALERIQVLTQRNALLEKVLSDDKNTLGAILDTVIENRKTIEELIKITDKRYEFLFNFVGGGWNSEYAYTIEEAKELAAQKYSGKDYEGTCVPDMKSFRISTPADYQNLLSLFY